MGRHPTSVKRGLPPSTEAKPQSVDIRITLPVKLEELYAGSTRFVNVDVAVLCQRCLGVWEGALEGTPAGFFLKRQVSEVKQSARDPPQKVHQVDFVGYFFLLFVHFL